MPLTLYRRHKGVFDRTILNDKTGKYGKWVPVCKSTDTQRCDDKRNPCPIWVKGTLDVGTGFIRKPMRTRDWAKATERLRELEATGTIAKPAPANVKRTTIEDWRKLVTTEKAAEGIRAATLMWYQGVFRRLIAFTTLKGIRYVDELDLPVLQEFRQSWRALAPMTRKNRQTTLKAILDIAVEQGWIERNPAEKLGSIKAPQSDQLPFSDEEMERILKVAQAGDPKIYTFILTLRYTGLRISDVAGLSTASLTKEGKDNYLGLRTVKTNTRITMHIRSEVADALRTIQPSSLDYFFWDKRATVDSNTDYWRGRVRPVFKQAKIENGHPHRYRHTFAVDLLKQGIPSGFVARMMGISEKTLHQHYDRWIKDRQQGLDDAIIKAQARHKIAPLVMEQEA